MDVSGARRSLGIIREVARRHKKPHALPNLQSAHQALDVPNADGCIGTVLDLTKDRWRFRSQRILVRDDIDTPIFPFGCDEWRVIPHSS